MGLLGLKLKRGGVWFSFLQLCSCLGDVALRHPFLKGLSITITLALELVFEEERERALFHFSSFFFIIIIGTDSI